MITRAERVFAERAAELLKIGAHATRLLIVRFLREKRGAYVQEIADELDMSQSAVSHQLRLLADADIVSFAKEGRDVRYALSRKRPAQKLIRVLQILSH